MFLRMMPRISGTVPPRVLNEPTIELTRKLVFATLMLLPLAMRPYLVGSAEPTETDVQYRNRETQMKHLLEANMLDPDWIRVAKLESGAQLNSNVARKANNFFGLHKAGKRKSTAIGRHGLYAKYSDMEACVADVRHWVDMSPRKPGERFDRFLRRRGWNHLPTYWRTLRTVQH